MYYMLLRSFFLLGKLLLLVVCLWVCISARDILLRFNYGTVFQEDTCPSYNNPTSVKRPVNLIVLLKSFGLNAISNITAISTFRSPLNISVKPFKHTYFNHEFAKQIANDQPDHLNLDRAVARAKENKVISQDLAEPFLNSEFNVLSHVTYNDLSIIAMPISSVAIVTVIMKYQTYRKVLTVASLMHQVRKVSTYPTLPSFIYTNAPTTIEPTITRHTCTCPHI